MHTLILVALIAAAPDPADPEVVCDAAARVLKDMRYVEGRIADPGDYNHPKVKARQARCIQVASLAAPHGLDVTVASVAVAYTETNFRDGVPGKLGELGMMQVLPHLHCKPYSDLNDGQGGCTNPERAGVRFLRFLLTKHSTRKALIHYNGSTAYADKVMRFVKTIRRSYRRQAGQLATVGH